LTGRFDAVNRLRQAKWWPQGACVPPSKDGCACSTQGRPPTVLP